ncbi:MAG: sugar ABC transporter permease [Chloroflexia bacterium]|nr:sugar ABC transporter permease [Chloroflexia bacterium]
MAKSIGATHAVPRKGIRLWSRRGVARSEALWGWIWISPWVVGFLIFLVGPMIASFYFSLTDYDLISPPRFVGLENYITALSGEDELFWPSLGRTMLFVAITVPLGVAGSLGMALLLNQAFRGIALFRTIFYLPSLVPPVAAALIWAWMLQPSFGIVNYFLQTIGLPGPPWMTSPQWALPSVIVVALWSSLGGARMLIFLAALQDVPQELTEAAKIDGANALQRFLNVTVPMISPVIFFNFVLGVIGSFSVFTVAYIATDGGPAYATWFYVLHLFHNAFSFLRMGYASALAWILFALLLAFTFTQFRLAKSWVHYGGETRADA